MSQQERKERAFAARRRARAFSLDYAAALLNISAGHLRNLELCRAPLTPVIAQRMKRAYKCTISDLFEPVSPRTDGAGGGRGSRVETVLSAS